jgi:hypothetical protein
MLKTPLLFLSLLLSLTVPNFALALTNSVAALEERYNVMVALQNSAPDQNGDDSPAFCVGTLISDHEIITAAHCVKDLYFHPELEMKIELGFYKYVTRPTGERVRVGYYQDMSFQRKVKIQFPDSLKRKLAVSKKRANIGPNDDVALIEFLPLELKREIPVVKIVNDQFMNEMRSNIKKYPLTATTINFLADPTSDYRRMAILNQVSGSVGHLKSTSTARVEPGDSGAPVFYDNKAELYLFAVVKGYAKTVFSNWDVYNYVHPFLCKELRHNQCQ